MRPRGAGPAGVVPRRGGGTRRATGAQVFRGWTCTCGAGHTVPLPVDLPTRPATGTAAATSRARTRALARAGASTHAAGIASPAQDARSTAAGCSPCIHGDAW